MELSEERKSEVGLRHVRRMMARMLEIDDDLSEGDLALLDRVAVLSTGDNAVFAEMRTLYESSDDLRVLPVITNYTERGVLTVDLATGETAEAPPASPAP